MKIVLLALGALLLAAGGFFLFRYTKLTKMHDEARASLQEGREAFLKRCPGLDSESASLSGSCRELAAKLRNDKDLRDDYASYQTPMLGGSVGAILIGGALVGIGLRKKKS